MDDLPALVRPTIATMGGFLFDIVAKLYHKVYKKKTGATDVAPVGVCRGLLLWGDVVVGGEACSRVVKACLASRC